MLLCDKCKEIGKVTSVCYVSLIKENAPETKNFKKNERELKRYPLDLCESCVAAMIGEIGGFVNGIKMPSKVNKGEKKLTDNPLKDNFP